MEHQENTDKFLEFFVEGAQKLGFSFQNDILEKFCPASGKRGATPGNWPGRGRRSQKTEEGERRRRRRAEAREDGRAVQT